MVSRLVSCVKDQIQIGQSVEPGPDSEVSMLWRLLTIKQSVRCQQV